MATLSGQEPDPTSAEPAHPTPPARARHRRRVKVSAFVLVLGSVFFFGPAAAELVGFRAGAIENRHLQRFPSIHDGWKIFPEFGTWATDHLVGRKQAVLAQNDVSTKVFSQKPAQQQKPDSLGYTAVVQGKDGWLFLGDDFRVKCTQRRPAFDTIARVTRLAEAVVKSGRKFVFVIAPDKSDIYPQYLPNTYVGQACATAFATQFWSKWNAAPIPGVLDVRTALMNAAAQTPDALYAPKGTHWDQEGVTVFAHQLADTLDPRLWAGTTVAVGGRYQPIGDLTYLLGSPSKDDLPSHVIVRAGVTPQPGSDMALAYTPNPVSNTSTSASLYQPKTLLLGDSFLDAARTQIAPFFADATLLHNKSSAQVIAAAMVSNDTIVMEVAERIGATGNLPLLLDDYQTRIVLQALASHPAR